MLAVGANDRPPVAVDSTRGVTLCPGRGQKKRRGPGEVDNGAEDKLLPTVRQKRNVPRFGDTRRVEQGGPSTHGGGQVTARRARSGTPTPRPATDLSQDEDEVLTTMKKIEGLVDAALCD
jgi:hypothetical protein